MDEVEQIIAAAARRKKQIIDLGLDKIRQPKKRRHKKRHGVNRKKSQMLKAKNNAAKAKIAVRLNALSKYHAMVKAYWRGEVDEHPSKPI